MENWDWLISAESSSSKRDGIDTPQNRRCHVQPTLARRSLAEEPQPVLHRYRKSGTDDERSKSGHRGHRGPLAPVTWLCTPATRSSERTKVTTRVWFLARAPRASSGQVALGPASEGCYVLQPSRAVAGAFLKLTIEWHLVVK